MLSPKGRRRLYDREGCGKLRHPHWMTALMHAEHLKKKGQERALGIYVCEFCNGLHVGRFNKKHKQLTEEHEV